MLLLAQVVGQKFQVLAILASFGSELELGPELDPESAADLELGSVGSFGGVVANFHSRVELGHFQVGVEQSGLLVANSVDLAQSACEKNYMK